MKFNLCVCARARVCEGVIRFRRLLTMKDWLQFQGCLYGICGIECVTVLSQYSFRLVCHSPCGVRVCPAGMSLQFGLQYVYIKSS